MTAHQLPADYQSRTQWQSKTLVVAGDAIKMNVHSLNIAAQCSTITKQIRIYVVELVIVLVSMY